MSTEPRSWEEEAKHVSELIKDISIDRPVAADVLAVKVGGMFVEIERLREESKIKDEFYSQANRGWALAEKAVERLRAENAALQPHHNELKWLREHCEALKKENAELTEQLQRECDHEFVTEDHSFSHEFGTEMIFVSRCQKCGKDRELDDCSDPDEPDPDRERDV